MRNVEVELPKDVVEALDAEAEGRDETRSRVAAEMVADWLRKRDTDGSSA